MKQDQPGARNCYVQSTRRRMLKKETMSIEKDEDPREGKVRPTPVEALRKVQIEGPDKVVWIWVTLPEE